MEKQSSVHSKVSSMKHQGDSKKQCLTEWSQEKEKESRILRMAIFFLQFCCLLPSSLVPTIAFPQHYLNLLSQILQETLLGCILTNDEKLLCCNCLGARPWVSHATIHLQIWIGQIIFQTTQITIIQLSMVNRKQALQPDQ